MKIALELKDMSTWKKAFLIADKKQSHGGCRRGGCHWKEGYSAHSLAEYFLNRHGKREIIETLNVFLGDDPIETLDLGIIECGCPFDADTRHPRWQDLGIWGKTQSNKTVFIGIEAKVNEELGLVLGKQLQAAEAEVARNSRSNRVKRIQNLCSWLHVSENDEEIQKLRYQLFHFTKATADVDANICVLLLLTFKTKQYKLEDGERNANDWEAFMERFFDKESEGNASNPKCIVGPVYSLRPEILNKLEQKDKKVYAVSMTVDLP